MIRDIHPFGLRMLPELKEQLQKEAHANARSLNAEIVLRLEHSLKCESTIVTRERLISDFGEAIADDVTADIARMIHQRLTVARMQRQLELLTPRE